jgi:HAAS
MSTMDVRTYAAAVRAAMADLGAKARAHLLEDLEGHLAEVAAESDVPLTERLGPPESYAAELRAAYRADARPRSGRPRRARRILAAALALVVVVGSGEWVVWQGANRDRGVPWSYAQLTSYAEEGQVGHVFISGDSVVAMGRDGLRHDIVDARGTSDVAMAMTRAGVDVTYDQTTALPVLVLAVLVPNLFLLAVVAALAAVVVVAVRRRRAMA